MVEILSKNVGARSEQKNKLIPRSAEDSSILTNELLKNLEDLEIHDPLLEDIKLMIIENTSKINQKNLFARN